MILESGALIEITPEVREAVQRSADSGLRATPARVETGGILTGTMNEGRLLINSAEEFRCRHKYGQAYQLSPEECDQMRAAAEAIRSSHTRQIAGYFRSCVGDRVRLFPDDEIVVRELLPEAQFILLARPLAAGVSTARLFERDAKGSWAEAAHFELIPNGSPAPVPTASRGVVPERRPSAAPRRQSFQWLQVIGGLAVVILLLAWYQSSVRRPAPIRNASVLGMRIATQGDSFWLTWDRNSAVVQGATAAMLRIRDGGGHRDIPLDVSQVQNGSLLYRPEFGDVTFQLEVHRNGAILASENIRVLDASRPAFAVDRGNAATPLAANTSVRTQLAGGALKRTRAVKPSQRQAIRSAPVSFEPMEVSRQAAALTSAPRIAAANSAPPPLIIPPGPLIADAPQSVPLRIPSAEVVVPPPQGTPKEQPPVAKERVAQKEEPKVIATSASSPPVPAPAQHLAPVQQAAYPALVTPPQPLRKVIPNWRSIAPQLLLETTTVDIQVSIDAAGRVLKARPVNTGKKLNQAVVGEAVKAAMQWTFEPATHRGKPVPATQVITFRFARGS
jgi:hypothetical protein